MWQSIFLWFPILDDFIDFLPINDITILNISNLLAYDLYVIIEHEKWEAVHKDLHPKNCISL